MSGELTFVFLDLAGFAALTEAMGDEEAAGLAGRLVDLAGGTLDKGDRVVKSIGDAVILASPDPRGGLMLTGRLLDAIETEPNFLVPRTGIHHGTAVERNGDFFGRGRRRVRCEPLVQGRK